MKKIIAIVAALAVAAPVVAEAKFVAPVRVPTPVVRTPAPVVRPAPVVPKVTPAKPTYVAPKTSNEAHKTSNPFLWGLFGGVVGSSAAQAEEEEDCDFGDWLEGDEDCEENR